MEPVGRGAMALVRLANVGHWLMLRAFDWVKYFATVGPIPTVHKPIRIEAGKSMPLGWRASGIAERELNAGVKENPPGSNKGEDIERYCMGQGRPGGSWCALFASYCYQVAAEEAGFSLHLKWGERVGAKRLAKELVLRGGHWVKPDQARQGDLAVFHRGRQIDGRWTWQGHVAIVHSVQGHEFYTIGGNEAGAVRKTRRSLADTKLVGFVRI